jgi:CheY-like chemotaxis protein
MRILVAEDDSILQLFARRVLEQRGHSVTVVNNGKDAVDAMQHARYDVVLMDIQMPIMDGIEATAAIREAEQSKGFSTPIIAYTAFDKCDWFLTAGMDGYLCKPASEQSLITAIHAVVRHSRGT